MYGHKVIDALVDLIKKYHIVDEAMADEVEYAIHHLKLCHHFHFPSHKELTEAFIGKDVDFNTVERFTARSRYDFRLPYPTCWFDYTHDGGHLNEKGQIYVAEKLIIMLTEIE